MPEAEGVGNSPGPAKASSPSTCSAILQKQLLAALVGSDVSVRRLHKILSTASGQETILSTVEYIAQILHHTLSSAPWLAIRARLEQLKSSKSASSSFKSEDNATRTTSSNTPEAPLLALSSLISETRYNIRLFGFVPLWIWGSNTIKAPPPDILVRTLTFAQIATIAGYQMLENVAYLGSKKILSKRFVNRLGGIDKCYLWSTRMWFMYICFQFVKLWRQHVLRKVAVREKLRQQKKTQGGTEWEKEIDYSASTITTTVDNNEQEETSRNAEIRAWKKSLVGNLLWGPLAFHWSFEKGIGIPKPTISCASFLAGAWELIDAWNVTVPL